MILYGKYKSFKSMVALYLAMCLSHGRPFFGLKTPELGLTVLYWQLEMPHDLWQIRGLKMGNHFPGGQTRMDRHIYVWTELGMMKLDRPEGLALASKQLLDIKPDVLIVDPIFKIMQGNLLDANSVQMLTDALDTLIARHEISVVLVHHTQKPVQLDGSEDVWGSDDMHGSSVFSCWADTIAKVTRKGVKDGKHTLQVNFDIVRHATEVLEPREVVLNEKDLTFHVPSEGDLVI
jgi:RecA-family ATPase